MHSFDPIKIDKMLSSHFIVDNLPLDNFSQIINVREILHRIETWKIFQFLIMGVVFGRKLELYGLKSNPSTLQIIGKIVNFYVKPIIVDEIDFIFLWLLKNE